jgi:putative Mg2+ transporter-C (MgtC) family protein
VNNGIPDLAHSLRLELMLQLALAAVLGGAIGVERELKGKPAGLRTNILICVGAALFTHLSLRIGGAANPDRIAAQLLSGVGFIGAGTILHMRGSVSGLTSAATIWVVSAIGMAAGTGLYLEAAGTTLLVMVVLAGLGWTEKMLGRHATGSHIIIHARPEPSPVQELQELIARTGLEIVRTEVRSQDVDLVLDLDLRGPQRLHAHALEAVVHHPAVRSVSTGE